MSKTLALKHYFGKELAVRLTSLIRPHYPPFPAEAFVECVSMQVEPLELKARVAIISEELQRALRLDYGSQLDILLRILGPENDKETGMFTEGYFLMPVAHFVERYGIHDFERSMDALYEITKRHTAEYALRPYLQNYPELCMKRLEEWSKDGNLHVRRLVSEGTRTRLPWAKRIDVLMGDPLCNLTLLEPLLNDPSAYVRKSVANHLNDLSKDHKELTLAWMEDKLHRDWIQGPRMIRHAVRHLLKARDEDALALVDRFLVQ